MSRPSDPATADSPGVRRDRAEAERDRRRAHRREELLDGALRVIRRVGPEASMEEIAAGAGITKPILYRHFGDKQGLSRAVAQRFLDQLLTDLEAHLALDLGLRELFATTLDAYLAFVQRERDVYRFLLGSIGRGGEPTAAALMGLFHGFAGRIAAILEKLMRERDLDVTPARPIAHGVVGMVFLAGDWWVQSSPLPREELVAHLPDLIWTGAAGVGLGDV